MKQVKELKNTFLMELYLKEISEKQEEIYLLLLKYLFTPAGKEAKVPYTGIIDCAKLLANYMVDEGSDVNLFHIEINNRLYGLRVEIKDLEKYE